MTNQSEQAKGLEGQLSEILINGYYKEYPLTHLNMSARMRHLLLDHLKTAYEMGKSAELIKDLRNQIHELEVDNDNLQTELAMLKGQSQPGIKQWVSVEESVQAAILHLTGTGIPADCREFFIEGIRFVFKINSIPPNSTTTSKSDMVSKEQVIEVLSSESFSVNYKTLYSIAYNEAIQECITKIKEI